MIESRDFPEVWAEGLRSAIYKAGSRNVVGNYRGITILTIFGKIFEILVHNRMSFVNEAFLKIDQFNGGFLKGSRTADNMFILNGLIERQLAIGKQLYVCFVDFSKAFDLVNRHILFYKLIQSGWSGRVIDTMRNFYEKTYFRVNVKGLLSPPIPNHIGVNQGGNASGLMFRKYLADLCDYLHKEVGVCIGNIIIAHLLWADDLILFSDTVKGLQRQLDGLYKFCCDNMMIVNELKTKVMVFGSGCKEVCVRFNGKVLECVKQYKYVGNLVTSIRKRNEDVLRDNYKYLGGKARQAIFALFKRLKGTGTLPINIMLFLFESLIKPILAYGSEIWGCKVRATEMMDKVFLWYSRTLLKVKQTTSNTIVFGEVGMLPPSIACHMQTLCYYNRLRLMNDDCLVKKVFNELQRLESVGINTWVTSVRELALRNQIDIDHGINPRYFKTNCKLLLRHNFVNNWQSHLNDEIHNPILRTYTLYKSEFGMEPYLIMIHKHKHRIAFTKLRSNSHTLGIERGRYTKPKTPVEQRLCPVCRLVDTEKHFMLQCSINQTERIELFRKIKTSNPEFFNLSIHSQFTSLMSSKNEQILNWIGKFIYRSFIKRDHVLAEG